MGMHNPEAISNWQASMRQIGLDGLTGFQRRGIAIKKAKLKKNPNYFNEWGQKIVETLGEDGLKQRGQSIAKVVDHSARGLKLSAALRAKRTLTPDMVEQRKWYRGRVAGLSRSNALLSTLENFHLWGIKGGFELDHKYSVQDGFENNISPEIMSHISNLQFILKADNIRKGRKSVIMLEELMENSKL